MMATNSAAISSSTSTQMSTNINASASVISSSSNGVGTDDIIGSWEKLKIVGKGGSSTVYKARLDKDGSIVAVKQIDTEGSKSDTTLGIQREIETMKSLNHPNILKYYGTQRSGNKIYIFLEYSSRGSLRQYYLRKGRFTEPQVAFCTRQIVLGLQYLHEHGIAHRDVKCANCLLFRGNTIKLADFGASKQVDSASIVSGLKGTPHWMAPEVIRGVHMTSGWMAADVWSLGCTIVEMLTGRIPFDIYDNPMTAMYHIASGQRPPIQGVEASPELIDFVNACCNVEPLQRPSVQALLDHEFLVKHANESVQLQAPTSGTAGSMIVGAGEGELGVGGAEDMVGAGNELEMRTSLDTLPEYISPQADASGGVSAGGLASRSSDTSNVEDSNLDTLAAGRGMGCKPIQIARGPVVSPDAGMYPTEQEPTPLLRGVHGGRQKEALRALQEHSPIKVAGSDSSSQAVTQQPAAQAVAKMITAATNSKSFSESDHVADDVNLVVPSVQPNETLLVPKLVESITPKAVAGGKKQRKDKGGTQMPGSGDQARDSIQIQQSVGSVATPSTHTPPIAHYNSERMGEGLELARNQHQHVTEKEMVQKYLEYHAKVSPRNRDFGGDIQSSDMTIAGVGSSLSGQEASRHKSQPEKLRSSSKPKQAGRIAPLRRTLRAQESTNDPPLEDSIPSIQRRLNNRQIPGLVLQTNGHEAALSESKLGQQAYHGRPANHPRSQSAGCGTAIARLPPLVQLRSSSSSVSLLANGAAGASGPTGDASTQENAIAIHARLLQQPNQRVIQSAPAVSRSVNLPPIGSQTPTYKAKKQSAVLMSLPEGDRR